MSVATAIFRTRSTRAYRAVRERLGLVTATLAEDIAGHARRPGVHARGAERCANFREVNERYRAANHADGRPERHLLPVRRPALVGRDRDRPRLRRLPRTSTATITLGTLFAFMLYLSNFFDPVQQLSQLYNTFLSATAALDKIMDVLDEEPEVVDAPGRRRRCRTIDGHVRFERRPLRLRRRARGAARARPRRPAGHDRRARRPHRRRQVDDREAARALLRPARGPDHDRRRRPARRDAGVAPPPARDRAAGGLPLRRHGAREHRLRPAGRARTRTIVARRADRRRARRSSSRLEDGYETQLQERGTRLSLGQRQLVALRARAARRPAHPHPRRGDLVGRHRHRAQDRAGAAAAARRPDGVRHRAPPLDDPRRRPDRRARARPRRRAGHARRADRAQRGLYTSLYGDWAADVA